MSADYPDIKAFCGHWRHAPMLQQTLGTLERKFTDDNDACIDAAKAMVECACWVLIENLDDPASPPKPNEQNLDFGTWMSVAVRVPELSEIQDEAFKKLIFQYRKLTTTPRDLRNKACTIRHGKNSFIAKLSFHQHRAALLAANAIVTFLHEAYLEREPNPVLTLEPFERFAEGNTMIDALSSLTAEAEEEGGLSVQVSFPNMEETSLAVTSSQLLFGVDREAYKLALNACREAAPEEDVA